MKRKFNTESEDSGTSNTNRRSFLTHLAGASTITLTGVAIKPPQSTDAGDNSLLQAQTVGETAVAKKRFDQAQKIRVDAAKANRKSVPNKLAHENNADDEQYINKIASYSKGLPHNNDGEVDISAYNALIKALKSGSPTDFNIIPLGGERKLTNPQAGLAFDLEGADAQSFTIPAAPSFNSLEIAAEIAENYWMALLRDVSFTEYTNHPIAEAAAKDLSLFGTEFKGPKDNQGKVTTHLLFRGITPGDIKGPYMSQFWYHDCNFGANNINQKIKTVRGKNNGGQDYMTDFNSWLSIQRGFIPTHDQSIYDPILRYIRNGRDLSEWVHVDVLFQSYFQAFLILTTLEVPVDENNPYKSSPTQIGFATFGGPHIASLLCEVATRALKAVWYQKWYVHRRLRPEVFASRIHRTLYDNGQYPVHTEILNSISSSNRLGKYLLAGNALLPQAFPEGSPTHPAYGAGHATVAGACVTILKAWFDESYVIPNPVVPDTEGVNLIPYSGPDLTVGGELNKLASNVALGRDMAGVHWRSDAISSLKLGEAIAISIFKDQKAVYNESFNGFSLTKFDGTKVVI
jgi:hypothetical protein